LCRNHGHESQNAGVFGLLFPSDFQLSPRLRVSSCSIVFQGEIQVRWGVILTHGGVRLGLFSQQCIRLEYDGKDCAFPESLFGAHQAEGKNVALMTFLVIKATKNR